MKNIMKDLIRKILKEETNSSNVLIDMVLELGWKITADMTGGFDRLYKNAFNNDYNNFLELYSNLKHEEGNDYDHYCLKDSYCPLLYHKPDNSVMISRDKIWSFFSNGLDYDIDETRKILKNWVESTYGLEFSRKYSFHPYSTVAPDGY